MQYYTLKSRSGNVVCFVGPVETNLLNDPVGIRRKTVEYLSDVYMFERITKTEAESYVEFGIAPLVLPRDLGIVYFWLRDMPNHESSFGYMPGYVDTA